MLFLWTVRWCYFGTGSVLGTGLVEMLYLGHRDPLSVEYKGVELAALFKRYTKVLPW